MGAHSPADLIERIDVDQVTRTPNTVPLGTWNSMPPWLAIVGYSAIERTASSAHSKRASSLRVMRPRVVVAREHAVVGGPVPPAHPARRPRRRPPGQPGAATRRCR